MPRIPKPIEYAIKNQLNHLVHIYLSVLLKVLLNISIGYIIKRTVKNKFPQIWNIYSIF